MRKTVYLAIFLGFALSSSTLLGFTGNGSLQVNTNTTLTGTVPNNTVVVIVGWVPVVNGMTAAFGNIAAYVNCGFCSFATIGLTQSGNAYVGQFTAQAGPPIILYPAFQSNSPVNLVNNFGTSLGFTFGCQGGAVTGACLFNVKTFPLTDPLF
ncbi:MAG: hypothetical protein M3S32_05935 [Acidobacteriota bacterium]|nr:hypothetical protein [Acidobacteriota bacterium]